MLSFTIMRSETRLATALARLEEQDVASLSTDELVAQLDEVEAALRAATARYRRVLAEIAGWRTHLADGAGVDAVMSARAWRVRPPR